MAPSIWPASTPRGFTMNEGPAARRNPVSSDRKNNATPATVRRSRVSKGSPLTEPGGIQAPELGSERRLYPCLGGRRRMCGIRHARVACDTGIQIPLGGERMKLMILRNGVVALVLAAGIAACSSQPEQTGAADVAPLAAGSGPAVPYKLGTFERNGETILGLVL